MRPSPLESIHFVAVSFGFIWIVYATKTSALYSSKLYILWHERWDDETSTKWVREREREREILLLYNNEAKVHLTQNNGFNFNYTPSTVYSTNSSIERPNDEPRICNNNSFFFLVTHFGVYFRSIKPSSLSYHTIICVLCVFGMNGSETMQHLLPPLHLLRVNFFAQISIECDFIAWAQTMRRAMLWMQRYFDKTTSERKMRGTLLPNARATINNCWFTLSSFWFKLRQLKLNPHLMCRFVRTNFRAGSWHHVYD